MNSPFCNFLPDGHVKKDFCNLFSSTQFAFCPISSIFRAWPEKWRATHKDLLICMHNFASANPITKKEMLKLAQWRGTAGWDVSVPAVIR